MRITKCQHALLEKLKELGEILGTKRIPAQLASVLVWLIWGTGATIKPLRVLHALSGTDGNLVEGQTDGQMWFRVLSVPTMTTSGQDPQVVDPKWLTNLAAHWQVGERAFAQHPLDYARFNPDELKHELEARRVREEKRALARITADQTPANSEDAAEESLAPNKKVSKPRLNHDNLVKILVEFKIAHAKGVTYVPQGVASTFCKKHLPDRKPVAVLCVLQRKGWVSYQSPGEWLITEDGFRAASTAAR